MTNNEFKSEVMKLFNTQMELFPFTDQDAVPKAVEGILFEYSNLIQKRLDSILNGEDYFNGNFLTYVSENIQKATNIFPLEYNKIHLGLMEVIDDIFGYGFKPKKKLISIIEKYTIPGQLILGSSTFNELGFDSLDVIELTMHLENEFNIQLPDDEVSDIKTIYQLLKKVKQKI